MALGIVRGTVGCVELASDNATAKRGRTGDGFEKPENHGRWEKNVNADVKFGLVKDREHDCDTTLMIGVRDINREGVGCFR